MVEPNPKLKQCQHCAELKAITSKVCVHCGGQDLQDQREHGLWLFFGFFFPMFAILWYIILL
jgi:hypothetical protein